MFLSPRQAGRKRADKRGQSHNRTHNGWKKKNNTKKKAQSQKKRGALQRFIARHRDLLAFGLDLGILYSDTCALTGQVVSNERVSVALLLKISFCICLACPLTNRYDGEWLERHKLSLLP